MYRNIAIAAAIVNNVLSQTNFQLVWNAHARGLLKFISVPWHKLLNSSQQ